MRIWRCDRGLIVERGRTSRPISNRDSLPEGPFRNLMEYSRIGAEGERVEQYPVMVWSIEEELGITAHAVIDGQLESITVREFWSADFHVETDRSVVATALVDVSNDPEAVARVKAVLGE